jgi:predicted phosphodiesterase
MMFRIGIISDTHGLLRPEAEQRLAGVDHIVHAGDIGRPEIIEHASPNRARHRHPRERGQCRVGP